MALKAGYEAVRHGKGREREREHPVERTSMCGRHQGGQDPDQELGTQRQ